MDVCGVLRVVVAADMPPRGVVQPEGEPAGGAADLTASTVRDSGHVTSTPVDVTVLSCTVAGVGLPISMLQ